MQVYNGEVTGWYPYGIVTCSGQNAAVVMQQDCRSTKNQGSGVGLWMPHCVPADYGVGEVPAYGEAHGMMIL